MVGEVGCCSRASFNTGPSTLSGGRRGVKAVLQEVGYTQRVPVGTAPCWDDHTLLFPPGGLGRGGGGVSSVCPLPRLSPGHHLPLGVIGCGH